MSDEGLHQKYKRLGSDPRGLRNIEDTNSSHLVDPSHEDQETEDEVIQLHGHGRDRKQEAQQQQESPLTSSKSEGEEAGRKTEIDESTENVEDEEPKPVLGVIRPIGSYLAAPTSPRRVLMPGEDTTAKILPSLSVGERQDDGDDWDCEAMLLWKPSKKITDEQVDQYVATARSQFHYSTEQALGILYWNRYSVENALNDLQKFTPTLDLDEWSFDEKILFEEALQSYGKAFNDIQTELPHKSLGNIIHYYYKWKRPSSRELKESLENDEDDDEDDEENDQNISAESLPHQQ